MKRILMFCLAAMLAGSLAGCKKEVPVNANQELMNVMDSYYLWYDKMPTVNFNNYPSPVELLEALTYKEIDRWSYITTKQEIEAYYDNAEYIGYGVGLGFDAQEDLRIIFVFENSPMRTFGVERGWRISAINGNLPTVDNINNLLAQGSASFTFVDHNDQTHTHTVAKRTMQMNTVLMDTTYTTGAGTVGYFVLKGFVGPTVDELNATFSRFVTKGVTELIVDLRYNGGGLIQTAIHLANLVAGKVAAGQVLGTYVHNDKHTADNKTFSISELTNSLALTSVVFITTGNSASASELVINGLFPYLDVTLVGTKTYGKPVGMYTFTSPSFDWAFVPICFKVLNANNEGEYYEGIPVDIQASDGINYPFGDLREASLAAAMAFIEGGKTTSGGVITEKVSYPALRGLKEEIGAW